MKGLGDEDFIRGYIVINWLKIISCYNLFYRIVS